VAYYLLFISSNRSGIKKTKASNLKLKTPFLNSVALITSLRWGRRKGGKGGRDGQSKTKCIEDGKGE
jgi:hypothetical protein